MCMQIAESLYQRGLISYPRTETNRFTPTMDVKHLVSVQNSNPVWGEYVSQLLDHGGYREPTNGQSDDQAHPPIHPVKSCNRSDFRNDQEWRVYDLITRHFLACCSDDAHGHQTSIAIEMGGELFSVSGLVIQQRNYLDIYSFDKWTGKQLPELKIADTFYSPSLEIVEGKTEPPPLLTEADLIKTMDRHGIGTDATMHEHIQTIQDRCYAEVATAGHFLPTTLGLALVKGFHGYAKDWLDLAKPHLRAATEREMNLIATGAKSKSQVLTDTLDQMLRIFNILSSDPSKLDQAMTGSFRVVSTNTHTAVGVPMTGAVGVPITGLVTTTQSTGTIPSMIPSNGSIPPSAANLTHTITTNLSKCKCGGMMSIRSRPPLNLQVTNRRGRGRTRSRSRRDEQQQQQSSDPIYRYLVCDNYTIRHCPVLPLPKRGQIQAHRFQCPACHYQVLKVANSTGHGFHYVCPFCFTLASPTLFGRTHRTTATQNDIENPNFANNQLRCFSCCHPTCALAGGR